MKTRYYHAWVKPNENSQFMSTRILAQNAEDFKKIILKGSPKAKFDGRVRISKFQ